MTVDAHIDALLVLTDAVQDAINAGDWQGAGTIEADRRGALEALVAVGTPSSGDHERLAKVLAAALDRSRRLIGEVDHHRRRLVRETATLVSGHAAVDRYASTARGDR